MEVHEFVLILMAMVVGLGIAEILRCSSTILLNQSRPGPIHAVWMTTVFLHLVEVVVASWGFRNRPDWTFFEILVLLAPTAVLYVAATVLSSFADSSDLDASFIERRRPFMGLLALMTVLYSVQGYNILFGWLSLGVVPDLIRVAALIVFGALAVTTSRRIHLAGAVAYLLLLIWFVMLYSGRLSDIEVLLLGT